MSFDNCDELLFRIITSNPNMWNSKEGRPSSAAFKCSTGTSVDRQGGREERDSIEFLLKRLAAKNPLGVSKFAVSECGKSMCIIKEKPLADDEYHCEIQ